MIVPFVENPSTCWGDNSYTESGPGTGSADPFTARQSSPIIEQIGVAFRDPDAGQTFRKAVNMKSMKDGRT
jgi:hypothetical protein